MGTFEKLGVFYIGTENRDTDGDGRADYMVIDSRDLTTHAMCVGMTGSGKTGLGICLLEEAAMDSIPAIVVDPKGDMGNLLLSFPDLLPSDFVPWIHPEEASREGLTVEQLAEKKASLWREGLASTMQSGDRIRAMRQNTEFALYTPGGVFGRPLSLQSIFQKPANAIIEDAELFQSVVSTTATSLLHLAGIDADPVTSREHVFLTLLIRKAWLEGRNFDLASLINWICKPPITTVGVMDIETYLPEKDRFGLALRFNNLLASPSFSAFLEGEPLDIHSLLYTPTGRPKISILSIAHLPDAERMFFVTLLLNRLVTWMRTEQGTSSLRALFYMDEVFGYFPPVAKPPSKQPLLTLLKTARAYGLGIVLATQNPGDIDYKGLSNIGTWFVGRLTTERDRKRLLEGMADEALDGMSSSELESLIAGLKSREFLMRSAGEKRPVLFKTRFCMSYLAGPLTRDQIRYLASQQKRADAVAPASSYQTAQRLGVLSSSHATEQTGVQVSPHAVEQTGVLSSPCVTEQMGTPFSPHSAEQGSVQPSFHTTEQRDMRSPTGPTGQQGTPLPQTPAQTIVQASPASPFTREQSNGLRIPPAHPASSTSGTPKTPEDPEAIASFRKDGDTAASAILGTISVPAAPTGVSVGFLPGLPGDLYIPHLAGYLTLYYHDEKKGVAHKKKVSRFTPLRDDVIICDWKKPVPLEKQPEDFVSDVPEGARFAPLPADARRKTPFNEWSRALVDTVWRESTMPLLRHKGFGLFADPEESESEFKARVTMAAREKRDTDIDAIRDKYEKKKRTIDDRLARAEERVERTKDQESDAKRQSAISIGSAILGGLLGRKFLGQSTVYRGTTAAKSISRAHKSTGNVERAEESFERVQQQLATLEKDMNEDLDSVSAAYESALDGIDTVELRPLKRDVVLDAYMLVWVPESAY
ncbi:MAG: hypothetical protein GX939_07015 [Clostridiaceae bacterium]|jgi:hypothetical protein|nr:hypothetical protein [Clostridiaceae bacterium]